MKSKLACIYFLICFVGYLTYCSYHNKKERLEKEQIEKAQIEAISNHIVVLFEKSMKQYNVTKCKN